MSTLVAVVRAGEAPPLGGGLRPAVVAHLYGGAVLRFVVHEVAADGSMARIPDGYAPDLAADPSYPVTDLLLATCRDPSAVAQRPDVLDTEVRANCSNGRTLRVRTDAAAPSGSGQRVRPLLYGSGFRERPLDSDVAWGSAGYVRHYEARSRLGAHRYEDRIAVGLHDGAHPAVRDALSANPDRLDAPVDRFESPSPARN